MYVKELGLESRFTLFLRATYLRAGASTPPPPAHTCCCVVRAGTPEQEGLTVHASPAAPSLFQVLTLVRQRVRCKLPLQPPLNAPTCPHLLRMLLPKPPLLDAEATQPAARALCVPHNAWGISIPRLCPGLG